MVQKLAKICVEGGVFVGEVGDTSVDFVTDDSGTGQAVGADHTSGSGAGYTCNG